MYQFFRFEDLNIAYADIFDLPFIPIELQLVEVSDTTGDDKNYKSWLIKNRFLNFMQIF